MTSQDLYSQLRKLSQVNKNIFITNIETSTNIPLLQSRGIKSILYLNNMPKSPQLLSAYKSAGIDHKYLFAYDVPTQDLSQFFDEIFTYIDKSRKNGNVLVHCTAGVSRSATAIIYYLIRKGREEGHNFTVDEVVRYMRVHRPIVNPNPGFIKQLKLALAKK